MKLLVCAVQFKGGSLQVVVALLREFIKFPDNNYFVIVSPEVLRQINQLSFPDNFHFYHMPLSFRGLIKTPRRNRFFRKIEKEVHPDCVLCSSGPLYWTPKAPVLMGFNLPFHLYPESPYFLSMGILARIRWAARHKLHWYLFRKEADAFFVQTEDANRRLKQYIGRDQVYTVSNTYNTAYNSPLKFPNRLPQRKGNEVRMLTISSYYVHKNLGIIMLVLDELKRRGVDNFRFVVTLPDSCYELIFEEEYKENIINVGFVPVLEGPSLYEECDIMFLPTLLECFSASYAEAMVMGKPIITSDLSFAHVVCGEAAVYFNPIDPKDIADKLVSLVENKQLQQTLISKGKEQMKQFGTSEDRARQVLEICKKLV